MRKNLGILIVLFLLVLSLTAVCADAATEGTFGTNVTWTLDDEGLLTIKGSGAMKKFTYSSDIPWYSNRADIKKVVIEEGITTLSDDLFYNATNLKEVIIPEGVTSIGDSCFMNAKQIENLILPSTLKTIENSAFSGMLAWKNVVIPEGVTTIGMRMFSNSDPTSITLPASLVSVDYSFMKRNSATVIKGYKYSLAEYLAEAYSASFESLGDVPLFTIKESTAGSFTWVYDSRRTLTIKGSGAMPDYRSYSYQPWSNYGETIRDIVIEDGITSIGECNFKNCTGVKSVTISGSVKTIGEGAFESCGVTELIMSEGVEKIDAFAFAGSGITKVVIPDSVTEISNNAFANCKQLKEITIPPTVKTIKDNALSGCSATVKGYTYSEAEMFAQRASLNFESIGECEYAVIKSGNISDSITWQLDNYGKLLISGAGEMSDFETAPWSDGAKNIYTVEVSENIESIGAKAFYNCIFLSEASLPSTLTKIAPYAFYGCSMLTELDIPTAVTVLGEYAFANCAVLNNVHIPEAVTAINEGLFSGCKALDGINIPSGVTLLGEGAFNGCVLIEDIALPAGVDKIENSVFENCKKLKNISIEGDITKIGSKAFYGTKITSFEIGKSVAELGVSAFGCCEFLDSVTIEDGIAEIPESCFANCYVLEKIVIPASVKNIGVRAFEDCKGLKNVTVKGDCSIGDYAFEGTVMWDIIFEGHIGRIGDRAFAQCQLGSLSFPKGVDVIDGNAFNQCSSLSEIIFTGDVQSIGNSAFYYCRNLRYVTFGERVNTIIRDPFDLSNDDITFYGYTNSLPELFANTYGYPFVSIGTADTDVVSGGAVNESITWSLTKEGVLILSGTGAMNGYTYSSDVPWSGCFEYIKHVVIENGINELYDIRLSYINNLESVTIPYTAGFMSSALISDLKRGVIVKTYSNSLVKTKLENNGISVTVIGAAPDGVQISGTFGDDACWKMTNTGILIFEGTGSTKDITSESSLPWKEYKDLVTTLEVREGITTLNGWCAKYHPNLKEIKTAQSVAYIKDSYYPTAADSLKIRGYKYSIGEYFAGKKGFGFVSMGTMPDKVIITKDMQQNLTWSLTSRGKLTVGGNGKMNYVIASSAPWSYYNNYITSVEIEEGVIYARVDFVEYITNLKGISFASSIVYIDGNLLSMAEGAKVRGYSGTQAEELAAAAGREFVSMGSLREAVSETGEWGDVFYSITNTGKLKLWGEGDLPVYDGTNPPWSKYIAALRSIEICDGIVNTSRWFNSSNYQFTQLRLAPSVIGFSSYAIGDNAVIYGYKYSQAYDLATDGSYEFVSLGIMENEIIETGEFNGGVTWTFDRHRNLVFSGTGTIPGLLSSYMSFYNLVENVYVNDSITGLEAGAFEGFRNLVNVNLGEGITHIPERVFRNCGEIDSLTLSKHLQKVETFYTFNNSKVLCIKGYTNSAAERLATVLDAKFESIGVIDERKTVLEGALSETVFFSLDNLGTLTINGEGEIPDMSKNSPDWFESGCYAIAVDRVVIGDNITRVGNNAFEHLGAVTDVEFGADVSAIGKRAFNNTGIAELKLPAQITEIGDYAFANCTRLESAWLPEKLETIPDNLFYWSLYLMHVEIGADVKKIGAAFDGTSLKYVHYKGTKSNWTNNVEGINNIPDTAEIFYASSLPDEVLIEILGVDKTTAGASVHVNAVMKGSEAVYAAGYDKDNILVSLKKITKKGTYKLTGEITKVKVFKWKSTGSMSAFEECYEKEIVR